MLVVILYYAIQNLQHEGFVNPSYTNFSIKFLTAEESRKFLLNDPDEYVRKEARKAKERLESKQNNHENI